MREALRRGREEVVAEQLQGLSEQLGHESPAVPVVLAQGILDRDQRVTLRPPGHLARQPGRERGRGSSPDGDGDSPRRSQGCQ